MSQAKLYIGGPVWGQKEWVGSFFPARTSARDFLRLYSERLLSVEGNTTFYALPSEEIISRWREETPPTFRFCPKIARDISHAARLDKMQTETLLFVERMRGLGERLGPMFLQVPPTFAPANMPQLEAFLTFWPRDLRLAVEVRHPAFYTEKHGRTLDTLLLQHKVARVMMDTRPLRTGSTEEQRLLEARERKPDLPLHVAVTTDFAFLRYIGHPDSAVNEPFLQSWSQQIADWLKQGITLYVFCHCPLEKQAPNICADLYQRVQALVALPPLPWQPSTIITQAAMPFDLSS